MVGVLSNTLKKAATYPAQRSTAMLLWLVIAKPLPYAAVLASQLSPEP